MIFIPAIIAGVAAIAKPVLVAAGVGAAVGAVTGAGTGAVVEVVKGVHEHGEVNQMVLEEAAHAGIHGGANGFLVGGIFGPVSLAVGPVVGAVGGVVDDIAGQTIGQIASATSSTATSVGRTVGAPVRMARSTIVARYYRQMPQLCSKGCVYVMDDAANGMQKIGVTTNPQRRIADVGRQVNSDLKYFSIAPVDDAFAAEAALKRQFINKNVAHPNYAKGTEWFNGLSPMDVATVMSK